MVARVQLYGSILAAALTAPISISPRQCATTQAPIGRCGAAVFASLTSLSLPDARIISATQVSGSIGYCAAVGVINQRVSTQDPDHFTYGIGFQVNLPNTWTGRFELMGGGGTDGSLRNPAGGAGTELAQGWVVAANDGGHENSLPNPFGWTDTDTNAGGTAHFGVDEQAREVYGYNAMGKTAEIAQKVIAYYYGREVEQSYFWGCSNGGREAMVALDRYPDLPPSRSTSTFLYCFSVTDSSSLFRAYAATLFAMRTYIQFCEHDAPRLTARQRRPAKPAARESRSPLRATQAGTSRSSAVSSSGWPGC
jgi:hypothetical protein